ncbi:cobalamin biosynthesis protein CbiG [Cytobacillus firmus]|nr:cobalamin biosynthesis protein [Cytobacillus firmus]MBG9543184.1 cobalamin biosynthesis protein CbiG [Cytobacillus firmus]MBG9552487.1 cobalamin biosynthesis protein CbiG [Cytobacillus firmus]MBG9558852.1 cobalamin biosynthesis protein CbiG [Cytobacillus firmus]MBG9575434.1 cobalamin biosynthesis protein CbiG [Cytobacillus firmus]MEC1892929.1 cobalamin biosynthesis protein [Cytobacillus firmus]
MISLREGEIPVIDKRKPYALVAITKHGVAHARSYAETFPYADLYYMKKFEHGDEEARQIQLFDGTVRLLLPALFQQYKGIICIISLGAVVRMIAPLLIDKKKDPAVLVVDDKGQFVISVLSGHIGGANALTHEFAHAIGASPVVTTASDVQKTIPVDLFGAQFGWMWDSDEKLTPVSASVVNEEHVAIVQETGEKNWWMYDRELPDNLKIYQSIEEAIKAKPQAALLITDRILVPHEEGLLENGVLYRPKSIVLGIGCNRGTSMAEIERVIDETLAEQGLSKKSVKAIASINLKKDEAALLEVTAKNNWPFVTYTPEELNEIPMQNPSDTVFKYTGAYGVSEPAAMRYAKAKELLLAKKKSGNVTISIARINFEEGRG